VSRRFNDVIASSVLDDRNDCQAAAIRSADVALCGCLCAGAGARGGGTDTPGGGWICLSVTEVHLTQGEGGTGGS
jgi:hypothetical protein